jgi:hypothetical protein
MSEEIKKEINEEDFGKPMGQEILPHEPELDFVNWEFIAKESKEKYDKLLSTVRELINFDLNVSNQDLLVMAFGLSPRSPQAKKFLTDRKYSSDSYIQLSTFIAKKLIKCGVINHEEKLMKIFDSRENCFSNVLISTIKGEPEAPKKELDEDNKELVGEKKDESEKN